MPSPPPPYSPGQNHNISQNINSSPHLSGNAFPTNPPPPPPPPPSDYAPSPISRPVSGYNSRPGSIIVPQSATSVTSNPQFPPPPPAGGKRSVSRDKLASKFSLSSFRHRSSESPGPSNIESLRINTNEALQRPPASPGIVPPHASQQYVSQIHVSFTYRSRLTNAVRCQVRFSNVGGVQKISLPLEHLGLDELHPLAFSLQNLEHL